MTHVPSYNSTTLDSSWKSPQEQVEEYIVSQFAGILGTKLQFIVTGGALTSPAVLTFLRKCFVNIPVFDSYGSTETGGIMSDSMVHSDVGMVCLGTTSYLSYRDHVRRCT